MPYELLQRELKRDPSRPFLTFYDDATGERVELSVATFDNWVAKTAGLLQDGLAAAPGDRVAITLPAHWQGLVCVMASWAAGLQAVLTTDDQAAVAVTGPELENTNAPDVVALSLRPLGGPFATPLPSGVLDYAVEVPGYPDRFTPINPPAPDAPACTDSDGTRSFDELVRGAQASASQHNADAGARLLVATDILEAAVDNALLMPLATGGSSVLVRHEDPATRARRTDDEKVTTVLA